MTSAAKPFGQTVLARSCHLGQLWMICELLLLLKVIYVFQVEERRQLFSVMCLASAGFLIHQRLPEIYRPRFFLLLSLIGFAFLLGWQHAGIILAVGLFLVGICHLPVALKWRTTLLIGAGATLAYVRSVHSLPFWPVLGSVFMFRIAIYLREMERSKKHVPLSQRLSYFFLLPNVCFPFFPVIDYQSFVSTYRNEDDLQIAQRGIAGIIRGITHILAYRFVKYHVLPPPEDILNIWDASVFLAANYALYLRVSGTFHIIIGMLQLFGFNLSRTHDWYFIAHSFSDIWRRINIYWKNFLTQHIFFPVFFSCRTAGNEIAIVVSVAVVFVWTWLLHSYQAFWLLGEFPLRRYEAGLWFVAAFVVAVNALVDFYNAQRNAGKPQPRTFFHACKRSLQTVAVFLTVSVFWGTWTHQTLIPGLFRAATYSDTFLNGSMELVVALVAIVVALAAFYSLSDRFQAPRWTSYFSLEHSPIPAISILALMLLISSQPIQQQFHTNTARVLSSLTVDYPTTLDLVRSVPGYYEELAATNLQVDAFFNTEQSKAPQGHLHFVDITRPRRDLMELELIPRWKGVLAGAPMSVNRWGMRDGPIELVKPPNSTRIAFVGSSVVMGYGVRDDEVFTELLETKLNAKRHGQQPQVELLNFGVGRYYSLHIAVALQEKVYRFSPDKVFYIAHQGELYGQLAHLANFRFARFPMPYPCLDEVMRKAGVTDETSAGSIQALLQKHATEITLCIYRGIVKDCQQHKIEPVWIYLPMPGIVEVSADTQKMLKLAADGGFKTLDLSHWADGRKPEEVKFNSGDHHPNAIGHQLIAERLFEALQKHPELLQSHE